MSDTAQVELESDRCKPLDGGAKLLQMTEGMATEHPSNVAIALSQEKITLNEEIVRVETENASLRERLDEAAAAAEDGRAPGPASYAGDDGAGKGRAVQIDLIKPELKPRLVAALETKL